MGKCEQQTTRLVSKARGGDVAFCKQPAVTGKELERTYMQDRPPRADRG